MRIILPRFVVNNLSSTFSFFLNSVIKHKQSIRSYHRFQQESCHGYELRELFS